VALILAVIQAINPLAVTKFECIDIFEYLVILRYLTVRGKHCSHVSLYNSLVSIWTTWFSPRPGRRGFGV